MEELAFYLKVVALILGIIGFLISLSEKADRKDKRDKALSVKRDAPLTKEERAAIQLLLEKEPKTDDVYYLSGNLAYIDLNEVEGVNEDEKRPVYLLNEQPVIITTVGLTCTQVEGNTAEVVDIDGTLVVIAINDQYTLVDEQNDIYPEGVAFAENGQIDVEDLVKDGVVADIIVTRSMVEKTGERNATHDEIAYLQPKYYAFTYLGVALLVALAYLILASFEHQDIANLVVLAGVVLGYLVCRNNGKLKPELTKIETYRGAAQSVTETDEGLLVVLSEDDRSLPKSAEYMAPKAWKNKIKSGVVGRFDVAPQQSKLIAFGPHRAIDIRDHNESITRIRKPKHLTMMFSILVLAALAASFVNWPLAQASLAMQFKPEYREMKSADDWLNMPQVGDTLELTQPKFCEIQTRWSITLCTQFYLAAATSENSESGSTLDNVLPSAPYNEEVKQHAQYFVEKPEMYPPIPDDVYSRITIGRFLINTANTRLRTKGELYWFKGEDLIKIAKHVEKYCHNALVECGEFKEAFAELWQEMTGANCDAQSCWQRALDNRISKKVKPSLENDDTLSFYRRKLNSFEKVLWQQVTTAFNNSFDDLPPERVSLTFNHPVYGELEAVSEQLNQVFSPHYRSYNQVHRIEELSNQILSASNASITATLIGIESGPEGYQLVIDAYLDKDIANHEFQKLVVLAILVFLILLHLIAYSVGSEKPKARYGRSALAN